MFIASDTGNMAIYLGGLQEHVTSTVTETVLHVFNCSNTSYKNVVVFGLGYGETPTDIQAYQTGNVLVGDPLGPGIAACTRMPSMVAGAYCNYVLPCFLTLTDMEDNPQTLQCTCMITEGQGPNNIVAIYIGFTPVYML